MLLLYFNEKDEGKIGMFLENNHIHVNGLEKNRVCNKSIQPRTFGV